MTDAGYYWYDSHDANHWLDEVHGVVPRIVRVTNDDGCLEVWEVGEEQRMPYDAYRGHLIGPIDTP